MKNAKEKAKYLLNVEGKKIRANNLIELIWKVLTKNHD
jgi:hypothetical protein